MTQKKIDWSGQKKVNLALQGGGAHGAFTWGVLDAILALSKNPKWGNPKNYDITVNREGDGLTTKWRQT